LFEQKQENQKSLKQFNELEKFEFSRKALNDLEKFKSFMKIVEPKRISKSLTKLFMLKIIYSKHIRQQRIFISCISRNFIYDVRKCTLQPFIQYIMEVINLSYVLVQHKND
jgi:hypothetical protein